MLTAMNKYKYRSGTSIRNTNLPRESMMTSTQYERLEDNDSPPQYVYESEAEIPLFTPPQIPDTVQLRYTELNRCCVYISMLNFLCCAWCGIPALIFTILGLEAEKKNARANARFHAHYMSLFNRMGCVCFFLTVFLHFLVYFIVRLSRQEYYSSYTVSPYDPTASSYNYNYN